MYQPLITFCPHPAIFTQVLRIFVGHRNSSVEPSRKCKFRLPLHSPFAIFVCKYENKLHIARISFLELHYFCKANVTQRKHE